jgi:hypothetical protein
VRVDSICWIAMLCLVSPARASEPESVLHGTVFVVRAQGVVTAERSTGVTTLLGYGHILTTDWSITVSEGGEATVLCSNDRSVRFDDAHRKLRLAQACAGGDRVAPGTYAMVANESWEVRRGHGTEDPYDGLTFRMRGWEEDDPTVPVLLEPRRSAVLDARPKLRWTRVTDAWGYWIELSDDHRFETYVRADEIACSRADLLHDQVEVCSIEWPEEFPDLAPNREALLRVRAQRNGAPDSSETLEHRVRRVSRSLAIELERSCGLLLTSKMALEDRIVREALLFDRHDLTTLATRRLRDHLAANPQDAEVLLVLGTLELERDLPRTALRILSAARELAPADPGLRAEIETREREARERIRAAGR